MITLKRLKLVNFGTFEDTEYFFDGKPKTVIGVNKTDDDQESNGSGKSWFNGGIQFATLGTNSRNETTKNLIRRGEKKAVVEIEYNCDIRDETLIVRREITKSGSKLFLFKNDTDSPVSFGTKDDGDERILEWLGTTKDVFVSNFVINGEKFESFFDKPKGRLQFVTEIAGLSFFDDIDSDIKEKISEKKDEVKAVEEKIYRLNGKIDLTEEQIEDLSLEGSCVTEDKDEAINKVYDKIIKALDDIGESEDRIACLKKDRADNEALELSLKKECLDIEKSIPDTTEINNKLSDLRKDVILMNKYISDAKINIQGATSCPKCHHEFVVGKEDVDIKEEEETIKNCKEFLVTLNSDMSDYESKLNMVSDKRKKLSNKRKELARVEDEILRIDRGITKYESNIEYLEEVISSKEKKISDIKNEVPKDNSQRIAELRKKLGEYKEDKLSLEKELTELIETDIYELNQWRSNFLRFKMFLANDTIKTIQNTCNYHLNKMGSDMLIKIDGFKVKSDGGLKEEVTPTVTRSRYTEFYNFNSYSKGERAKLEIAMILSKQDILNSLNKQGGIKLLVTDEVVEGLDRLGVKNLMKSIKNIGQDVLITTHISNEGVNLDSIVIEKVNGVSNVINN